MHFPKLSLVSAAATTLALCAAPAFAQQAAPAPAAPAAAAQITVGQTVYGAQGAEVGKVAKVDGDTIVVDTGKHMAGLNRSTFAAGANGLTIQFTREQLDTATENAQKEALAKVEAALVAGAAVRSADGQPIGAVKTVNADGTVVVEAKDKAFALKKEVFTLDASGLAISLTAQQLAEAAKGGAPKSK